MALWGQGEDIGSGEVWAGVPVSQDQSIRLSTVYACVRLISESIASLPADVFRDTAEGGRVEVGRPPSWIAQPNPETTWFEFVQRVYGSLLTDGNAFILIAARDSLGFPSELWTLDPQTVQVERRNGRVAFVWNGSEPLTAFTPSTPAGDVLHVKAFSSGGLRGLSPLEVARQAIGLGLVTEKFGATFFGKGTSMSGVIEVPQMGEQQTEDAVKKMRENWEESHAGSSRAHRPGVLVGGAHWNPTSIPPEQAQFLETRKFQVVEICRFYGVPPFMIQEVDTSTSWGTGLEQQSIGFVRFTLTPWIVRGERAFDQLTPRGQFMKWNVNGLLRGDMAARAAFYHSGITDGWMLRSEPREFEDLEPVKGLDKPLIPSNLVPANPTTTSAPPPAPTPMMPSSDGQEPVTQESGSAS